MKKAIFVFLILCLICSLVYSKDYVIKEVQSKLDVDWRALELDSFTIYDEDGNIQLYYGDAPSTPNGIFFNENNDYRELVNYEYRDGLLCCISSYSDNPDLLVEQNIFEYDQNGLIVEDVIRKISNNGNESTRILHHEYEDGKEVEVSDWLYVIEKTYSSEGVLLSETKKSKYFDIIEWIKEYNTAGQIIRKYDKDGEWSEETIYEYREVGGELVHKREIKYNNYFTTSSLEINTWYEKGQIKSVDYGGVIDTNEINDEGQITKTIRSDGEEIIWEYDSEGRVTREAGIFDKYFFHEYLEGGITYSYEPGYFEEVVVVDDKGNETYYCYSNSMSDDVEERWTEYEYYPDGAIRKKTIFVEYHDLESIDIDEERDDFSKIIEKYFNN